jgi:hypothetical protein
MQLACCYLMLFDRLTTAVCRVAGDVQWSRERCLLQVQCCLYRFACLLPNLGMLCHFPNLVILLILPNLAIFAILLFLAHLLCVIVA